MTSGGENVYPAEVEEALLAFCAERLARYKVPSRVVVVDELPRNATGKVLKGPLRDLAGSAG